MTVQELRIGNKVQDANGFIFDVVSIHKDGTVYCDFDGNEGDVWEFDNENPCYGVELTGEILLKCGFELKGLIYRINNGKDSQFDVNYSLVKGFYYFEYYKNSIRYVIKLNYLHQLQNLYFDLAGKKLEVNL